MRHEDETIQETAQEESQRKADELANLKYFDEKACADDGLDPKFFAKEQSLFELAARNARYQSWFHSEWANYLKEYEDYIFGRRSNMPTPPKFK